MISYSNYLERTSRQSDCASVLDFRQSVKLCALPQFPTPSQTSPSRSFSTRARQEDSTCAWTGCFEAGWRLSLSCVRVSQSVGLISLTNFRRRKKVTIIKNHEPERRSGVFQHILTKRNGNTFAFHKPERHSGAFRSISSTGCNQTL